MDHSRSRIACIGASLIALSACGGGSGGGSGLGSTPPPAPTPPPPPPPGPTVALVDPAQTSTPASPVATPGGSNFDNPAVGTVYPLMLTAVSEAFNGDTITTSQGATLEIGAGQELRLTINNAALGVNGQPALATGLTLEDGRFLQVFVPVSDLDYARFGNWLIWSPAFTLLNGAAWLGGYITPVASLPTTGTANFSGKVGGLYSEYHLCSCSSTALIHGDVQLIANFGSGNLTGTITNLVVGSDSFLGGPVNNIGFSASLQPNQNLFIGSTSVTSSPGGQWALDPNATGSIQGRFFGPSAQEVGAVWTLSDGIRRVIGSFGARGN